MEDHGPQTIDDEMWTMDNDGDRGVGVEFQDDYGLGRNLGGFVWFMDPLTI